MTKDSSLIQQKWAKVPLWRKWAGFIIGLLSLGFGIQWTVDAWHAGTWAAIPFTFVMILFGLAMSLGTIGIMLDL